VTPLRETHAGLSFWGKMPYGTTKHTLYSVTNPFFVIFHVT